MAEIVHIAVDLNGPTWSCGNTGFLELYAGFLYLLQRYKNKKWHTVRREDVLTEISDLFEKAYAGDKKAERLVRQQGEYLGIGAVSLANIFSPEYIFVSPNDVGDVDLEMTVEEIRKYVEKKAFSVISKKVKVEKSGLGVDIHLYGGIALVMQDFFNTPSRPPAKPEAVARV